VRRLRVLTYLHSFEPGGVERIGLRLVRAWQERGFDAPLLMGRDTGLARPSMVPPRWSAPTQPPFGTAWWETLWVIRNLPDGSRGAGPICSSVRATATRSWRSP
jgi:hypothetical protein